MKPEFQALLLAIQLKNKTCIQIADAGPLEWYELFVNTGPKEGSHTEAKGSTFAEVASQFESVAQEYGLDRTNIDIWWTVNGIPKPHTELITPYFMYDSLRDYFTLSGELPRLKMVGTISYDISRSKNVFTRDYRGQGAYFADQIAFTYFRNVVCYIPQHGDPADPDCHYTRSRLVALCGGDEEKAARLFGCLSWEYPETLLNDWDDDNE